MEVCCDLCIDFMICMDIGFSDLNDGQNDELI